MDDGLPDFSDPHVIINWSQFHPLDHHIWECRGYPGGWRRHAHDAWFYRLRDRIRSQTLCRIGQHDPQTWTMGIRPKTKSWVACYFCGNDMNKFTRFP